MIYGTPGVHIEDDQTDRIGIRTIVLSQMWQPKRWPLAFAELDEETPAPPQMPGGMWLIGQQTRRGGGCLRTIWTFEGINGNGKSVTFKERHNSTDYQFEPGFSQVSILKHPRFRELREQFGGVLYDTEVIWPEMIKSGAVGTGLSSGRGDASEKPNPMFGQEDYLRVEGTYTFRYAAFDPSRSNSGTERIYDSGQLPGKAPPAENRNWLKAPSPWQRRGPVFEIAEVYWLSGEGGWTEAIYKKGGGNSRGLSAGGLQTGTL